MNAADIAIRIDSRIGSIVRLPMLFMVWFVLMGAVAYGQGTATIVGTVTDATGAVVPNAKITITNLDNGFIRTTTTNGAGSYNAPELPIGNCRVQVEASGFKTSTSMRVLGSSSGRRLSTPGTTRSSQGLTRRFSPVTHPTRITLRLGKSTPLLIRVSSSSAAGFISKCGCPRHA